MDRVPVANASTNRTSNQVVGNKSDSAVTTVGVVASIIAYVKGILSWLAVGTVDGTANASAADVIGNKTDAKVNAIGTTKSLVAYIKGILGYCVPAIATGTTGIDDSVQTETTAWPILTIAPATGAPLRNVKVVIDLAKATDGFAVVESSCTINFRIGRKVDGTNWRIGQAVLAAALSGTLAAGRSVEIDVGVVGVTEQARIYAELSADATSDMNLPYMVAYEGMTAPTITPVVNG